MSNHRKKYRRYKKKVRELEKKINFLYNLISKISIRIKIENNPVNANHNKLLNVKPDALSTPNNGSKTTNTTNTTSK